MFFKIDRGNGKFQYKLRPDLKVCYKITLFKKKGFAVYDTDRSLNFHDSFPGPLERRLEQCVQNLIQIKNHNANMRLPDMIALYYNQYNSVFDIFIAYKKTFNVPNYRNFKRAVIECLYEDGYSISDFFPFLGDKPFEPLAGDEYDDQDDEDDLLFCYNKFQILGIYAKGKARANFHKETRLYMQAMLSANISDDLALFLIEYEEGFKEFLEGPKAFEAYIKWHLDHPSINFLSRNKEKLEETFSLDPDLDLAYYLDSDDEDEQESNF